MTARAAVTAQPGHVGGVEALGGVEAGGLPIMLRLAGRPVLVVGGGPVAASKARSLTETGALVTMVAPRFCDAARLLDGVQRVERSYEPADLDGRWLVVAAVDCAATTARVAADAERARVFCNAADRPQHCSATLMATCRQGAVTVAVSTDGTSPAAASWLRNRIAGRLRDGWSEVIDAAADARRRIRRRRSSEGLAWLALLDELAGAPAAEHPAIVDRFVDAALTAPRPEGAPADVQRARRGGVSLVGAGPGGAELLTVAAVRALGRAEVVVHDALVGDEVLAAVPNGVELIDVGKRPGRGVAQELINVLLVELAEQGKRVVRLKGGDPYLFGRGGEEAVALQRRGIDVEVIPGISAALAAPALAGIPVTHRGVAPAVTVVTGHRAAEMAPVEWAHLAGAGATIVVLMGVAQRSIIADALQHGGLPAATPVAVIESAGRPEARVTRTTLQRLGAVDANPPATIVIGAVAALDLRPPLSRSPRDVTDSHPTDHLFTRRAVEVG